MREGDVPSADPEKMMRRVWGFVGIWLMLLVILPIGWVVAGAGLWFAMLIPGLIEIHKQFQNEPDEF